MSIRSYAVLFSMASLCASATAQIGWNPIPSTVQPTPFNPPSISFTPIGSTFHGSDGSAGVGVGNTTIYNDGRSAYSTGDITTHSDGTMTREIGEIIYGQRPDGSQFYCTKVAEQTICRSRGQ